jgi:hypothetical protein
MEAGGPGDISGRNDDNGNGGVCTPCPDCQMLTQAPCDSNCGYNGFSNTPLVYIMSQSNYMWGTTNTILDPNGNRFTCFLCQCSGTNYCYARFAGKVQKFLEDPNTHIFKPTENPNGTLYDTGRLNLPMPMHLLSPNAEQCKAGNLLALTVICDTCCGPKENNGNNENAYCACNADLSLGDISMSRCHDCNTFM